MKNYITVIELAKRFKVSRGTIVNWRKQGLPALKIGRSVRFDPEAVEKWFAEHNREEWK